jgi:aryl-alcohol dehydrogenase-like predicted oxidoreductase
MLTTSPFGRTGHESSRVIFGAAGLWSRTWGQEWANELLDHVVDAGVNHIDTAASYGDSEVLLAPWLAIESAGVRNRDRVFLATKTDERTADGARTQLERSLTRLGVDSVDLIQLHNLVEDDEWDVVHGPGGALEALVAARDEGLVHNIGVTGHGIRIAGMHIRSLQAHDYDSILLPYNTTLLDNPVYRTDLEAVLELCQERSVAVQTIKSIARRRWPEDEAEIDVRSRRSWYQPLRDSGAIHRAMQVVLSNEQLFLNTSSDTRLMNEMLLAAGTLLAGDGVETPDPDAIRDDIAEFGMAPLFDGAELERI